MKHNRIHITGASGSGTTTLGKVLAEKYNYVQLDSDSYFWLPSDPPFQFKREIVEKQKLLKDDMLANTCWISSGSLWGWGEFAIELFDLVIFLYIPQDIRIQRLNEREKIRSPESFIAGSFRQKKFQEFIAWAKRYDSGGDDVRSLHVHNEWLKKVTCPILRIEENVTVEESVKRVEEFIEKE